MSNILFRTIRLILIIAAASSMLLGGLQLLKAVRDSEPQPAIQR